MNDSLKNEILKRGQFAVEISHRCAEIALEFLGKSKSWNKSDSSPVTEADLAIDQYLQSQIKQFFPHDAILSEESEDISARNDCDICWIIDPIDGTKEFIKQSDEFCVMIGICYKGEPLYGVIHIPVTKEIFYGGEYFGVNWMKNNSQMNLPEINPLGNGVLISRSHRKDIVLPYVENYGLQGVPCGSSGVKACRLIDQTAHHYIHGTTIHEWDTAAADALVRGAGGYFTDICGQPIIYNKPIPKVNGVIGTFSKPEISKITNFFAPRLAF